MFLFLEVEATEQREEWDVLVEKDPAPLYQDLAVAPSNDPTIKKQTVIVPLN